MPTSNNGSTYGHSSHSHGSRTRLNTHGSNSNVTRLDRDRSGSPTEYYKAKQSREDGIGNLVFDMNVFIHKGIEKFLDKQAVRDLLHGYDNDDIYIGGTDIFFAELAEYFGEGEGAVNFSYSERKRLNDIALNLGSSTVQFDNPNQNTLAAPGGGAGKANPGLARVADQARKKAFSQSRASLWRTFFTVIRIKIFNAHHRAKSALRQRNRTGSTDIFAKYP